MSKSVPGYPSYAISPDGTVTGPRSVLKPDVSNKRGYHRVTLYANGGYKRFLLHRLVLMAFKPVPDSDKLQVRHMDGDVSNNHIDNLEWGTAVDNWNDRKRHGRVGWSPERKATQVFVGNKTLSNEQVDSIRSLRTQGLSYTQIANTIKCSKSAVAHIIKGRVRNGKV